MVLRNIVGPKKDEVTGKWRRIYIKNHVAKSDRP
jgi:hypothetical protein